MRDTEEQNHAIREKEKGGNGTCRSERCVTPQFQNNRIRFKMIYIKITKKWSDNMKNNLQCLKPNVRLLRRFPSAPPSPPDSLSYRRQPFFSLSRSTFLSLPLLNGADLPSLSPSVFPLYRLPYSLFPTYLHLRT